MKKISMLAILAMLVISSVALVIAPQPVNNGNSGSIWTTNGDCGAQNQDVNHYAVEEEVYINGAGFAAENYDWKITGKPGGASCDPNMDVVTGAASVDSSGSFCFKAYTIASDDCGEYGVEFGGKHDNYRVDEVPSVPEFGIFAGALTVMAAIGIFFFVRRK